MVDQLTYSIAGLTVRLRAAGSGGFPVAMPRSMKPFLVADTGQTPDMNVLLTDDYDTRPAIPDTGSDDDTSSDMGRVRLFDDGDGWHIVLTDSTGRHHHMKARRLFDAAVIHVDPASPEATASVSSLLRIAFSQMALTHGAAAVHASAIITADGSSCLFLGPSGTGKSTHSRLWTETVRGTSLLNDDNPIVRVDSRNPAASATVYGSPWSGKTPCYRPVGAPLRAIVRLHQSAENRFTPLGGIDAFLNILPSCSTIRHYPPLHDALCDIVTQLAATVISATMHCRPDSRAVFVCKNGIFACKKT